MTEVEHIIYEFLWNGKPHKVKTKLIIQDYANGGCKMIVLEEMINAQKIKMIKKVFVRGRGTMEINNENPIR